MTADKQRFTIRVTASRLGKGLLAIPQKFRGWFPSKKSQIRVLLDDERERALTFHPYDPVVKENRIFGLGTWFAKRGVREGDLISVTLEDPAEQRYRITLDRFVREQEERRSRDNLQAARTDSEAEEELNALSRLTKRRPRQLARQELLRIAQESTRQPRLRVSPSPAERHEGVPSAIRVLLRELHDGKCQLCSFTFEKRNGQSYSEIHHLDPEIGHHPNNLLLLCANCHAQFEHANVTDFEFMGSWLVGVTINGRRVSVRQPLIGESVKKTLMSLVILWAVASVGRFIIR